MSLPKIALLGLTLSVASSALVAQNTDEAVQEIDRIMVTGSLAEPAGEPVQIEKYMVTGSLAEPAGDPVEIEKYMVTGSLAEPASDDPVQIDRYMVTGSLASEPIKTRPAFALRR